MKRYLLFAGEDYYPKGGAEDLIGDYSSLEECNEAITIHYEQKEKSRDTTWHHVLDTETKQIVLTNFD